MDSAERLSILVAEDQPLILEILRRHVAKAGFNAIPAATGYEALLAVHAHRLDGALVDYELPDINAPELISKIKESGRTFPVIVLSGYQLDRQLVDDILRAGAVAFLPKGIGLDEILCALKSFLPPLSSSLDMNSKSRVDSISDKNGGGGGS